MVGFKILAVGAVGALSSFVAAQTPSAEAPLPTVDLGYAVHRPTLNTSGYPYYNFSNIRYAAPPTGDLRFRAPVAPAVNRTLNDGQDTRICHQANPAWLLTAVKFISGTPAANLTEIDPLALGLSAIPKAGATESEDCLFLDVIVPTSIYSSYHARKKRGELSQVEAREATNSTGRPVLVWIYGGGYTGGSKAGSGNPASLLARARDDGEEGLIYVALNYRLGAYGWLSGPTFQEDGTANAGLWDQKFALEWIQTNIHLFGGDPDQVTVIGESAGAGSIMHQITAFGGNKGKVPFKRAIAQSPGWLPLPSTAQNEAIFEQVLQYAGIASGKNVTDLATLRTLNETELYLMNYATTAISPYGSFTYGPSVDGNFVPQLPGQLLLHGQFDKTVEVMTGHNANEGLLFTSPFVRNETAMYEYAKLTFPAATNKSLNYVLQTLYPPPPAAIPLPSFGYIDYVGRLALLTSELAFICNARYLDTAFNDTGYAYYFTAPIALHGQDVGYTFFNGDTTTPNDGFPVNATIATALQDYLTSFAMTGTPNEPGVPYFPVYGQNSTNTNVGPALGKQIVDTAANPRCDYWQKGLYF